MSFSPNVVPAPFMGAGLGFRRGLAEELSRANLSSVAFMEVAPENWIGVGGRLGKTLREFNQQKPFAFHGLSLSLGGNEPIDTDLVRSIGLLMDELGVEYYSEHLSACSYNGHLYDLMPIPMTESSVAYVVERIQRVQDILGRNIAIENVSAYLAPGQEMPEIEFISQILERSKCQLLFDVNNLYVNSINFQFDPIEYLKQLPGKAITYMHIAGHYNETENLLVDTHGAPVKGDVWNLLREAYRLHGVKPTLLERDFNYPPVSELLGEINMIRQIQSEFTSETSSMAQKVERSHVFDIG